jgi:transcriptional regulator with XRE-family HTH domain
LKKPRSKVKLFTDVGERLRQLRGDKSQKQFSEELNVPFRSYCRYESGERPPPLLLSVKIARLNKTTVDWIMGGIPVEEGDEFNENSYRQGLIRQLVRELELSLERQYKWFQKQGFKYSIAEDETFQGWKDFTNYLHDYCEKSEDPQFKETKNEPLDLALMLEIIEKTEMLFEKHKLYLSPKKKAKLLHLLYEEILEDRKKMNVLDEKVISITRGLAV